ncbi:MAG: asparagine synthase-related protein [Patescibacteria group bacterium]
MCSIAGITSGNGIERMIDVQKHRAPDESGFYRDDYIELGMGRLKIIDLQSPGLAPYQEDGLVLCYNGEIYNYLELKKELQTLGWKFSTTSDTEVLLKSWRQWGTGMFEKLNGMFACAIYDTRTHQLLLARDISGEKPLYYYQKGRQLVFSSEAKAFPKVLNVEEQDNDFFEAFQHCFLTTLWKDVFEVPPAHYILFDLPTGTKKLVEYWKFRPRDIQLKTAEEELENLIEDAVKLRIRSDVPIGLYFSKGIDSSLIADLHHFDFQYYFDHTDPNLQEEFFARIPKVLWHLDFPVGSFGFFGMWKLAERASKQVRVILSGEGADELFGGYVRYMPIASEYFLRKKYPSYEYLFGKHFGPEDYVDAFTRVTCRNTEHFEMVREILKPFFAMFPDPVNAMGFADFKLIFPSLMQMGDRMAGAFGIENRCPFLDRRIIEFAFSLPPAYKIDSLHQKVILRRIAAKHGLQDAIAMEKRGMSIPYNTWRNQPGWDRTHYFRFLQETWHTLYQKKPAKKPSLLPERPVSLRPT